MNYNIKNTENMPKAAVFAIKNWKENGINNPEVSPVFGIELFNCNHYVFKEENTYNVMCVIENNGEFSTVDLKDFTNLLKRNKPAYEAFMKELVPAMAVKID